MKNDIFSDVSCSFRVLKQKKKTKETESTSLPCNNSRTRVPNVHIPAVPLCIWITDASCARRRTSGRPVRVHQKCIHWQQKTKGGEIEFIMSCAPPTLTNVYSLRTGEGGTGTAPSQCHGEFNCSWSGSRCGFESTPDREQLFNFQCFWRFPWEVAWKKRG